jgi:hypothetical protein
MGGNETILDVYVGRTLLGISKGFPGNEYKLSGPKSQPLWKRTHFVTILARWQPL